jgi:tetratricopeptide (TPR) repeat protein
LTSRGYTWHEKGRGGDDRAASEDRALADYAEAIRIDPNLAAALNNRAWILATSQVERCRDGRQAVEEATRACELTGWKEAGHIDTLSVAYAEAGDFDQAIRWQRKALEDPSYEREERDNAREKLALYDKKQPFREVWVYRVLQLRRFCNPVSTITDLLALKQPTLQAFPPASTGGRRSLGAGNQCAARCPSPASLTTTQSVVAFRCTIGP